MSIRLMVVPDGWLLPDAPGVFSTLIEFCTQVYSATPPWCRNRWVMSMQAFSEIQAESMQSFCSVPVPGAIDMLFGIPVVVQDGGGLPHLE